MSQLIDMLIRHEGSESHAYTDTVGKVTIGVGRNIDPDGGLGLSPKEISYLLQNDVNRVEDELVTNFPWVEDIEWQRMDALANLCFNLGMPRFKKFKKALAAAEAGNWELCADEFIDSMWASQVGQRAIEVTNLIRTGEYE
jgi:lysozyme|tara:strand:- start:25 stop:447 length:423 start_codon:yes stop_codon:yes gene_type:complete